MPLRVRPFHVPGGTPAGAPAWAHDVVIIVQRELGTVGEAKAALREARRAVAGSGGGAEDAAADAARLVLGGIVLQPDEALLWDAGCRPGRTLHWL
jgi:hypothetical protein